MTVLYVGGKKRDIPQLSGTGTLVDYVQNGMIALSAAQTQSFDAIIIEDQLPLMTASRLIEEFVSIKQEIPLWMCVPAPTSQRVRARTLS